MSETEQNANVPASETTAPAGEANTTAAPATPENPTGDDASKEDSQPA